MDMARVRCASLTTILVRRTNVLNIECDYWLRLVAGLDRLGFLFVHKSRTIGLLFNDFFSIVQSLTKSVWDTK